MPIFSYYLWKMEHHFTHQKTFRYQLMNERSGGKKALYVLHGYGQLVEYFIRKFREVSNDYVIIAPEGMHRFYLTGTSGRVGASWMTKEARETDIADTISYLNALDAQLSSEFDFEEKYVLGFSQGGATAARWNQLGTAKFDAIILWASLFPPDLPVNIEIGQNQQNYFAIGDEDEFYSPEAQETIIAAYSEKNYRIRRYVGKHDIVNNILTEILVDIKRK